MSAEIHQAMLVYSRRILESLPDRPPAEPVLVNLPDDYQPGLFVTLKKQGALRGCIGTIIGYQPVSQAIAELTRASAWEDRRFSPVQKSEYPDIRIEISLLSPPHPVSGWSDIRLGIHGIILALRGRQAIFLPQVPGEQDWDLGTTLNALSRKAGLPPEAWLDSQCCFQVFEAVHFGEPT